MKKPDNYPLKVAESLLRQCTIEEILTWEKGKFYYYLNQDSGIGELKSFDYISKSMDTRGSTTYRVYGYRFSTNIISHCNINNIAVLKDEPLNNNFPLW